MKKIAQGIVRLRKLILTVAFLLLIPSAIGAVATRINYDVLTYLPQELDSMIGEVALEDDFHLASTGMITVEGLPTNELIAMKKEIEAVPGVTQTFWLSDVIDPSIPTAMLPADVQQFMFGKNDSTMLIVRFDAPSASDETMEAVAQIEKLLRKDCFFGGMSVILQDTKALVNQEMPLYILIAVGASLLVLFLSLESTITPVLFMLGLLFPIAYNFGTNIFLGQISYITQALSTVLQLGVTMDFSIFLLHRYQEEKELRSSNEEAMVTAICKTMTSISASSLTTIAGFLALCAMRLTLGRDIGLVMAKGVALGVICTVVILPSLILTFDKWVDKFKHRTGIPRLTKLSYFVSKHSVPIVAIFILILIPFAIAQNKTSVYYTLFDSLPQDLTGIVGTNKLGEDFGMTTSHFILVPVSSAIEDTLRSGGLINISALSLVLGEYAAPMGTGAAIVLVACGLFLWMQKDVRLSASLSFLITAGLIVFFFPRQLGLTEGTAFTAGLVFRLRCVRDEMLTGAMLFSAVFLLNEPYTCAHHRRGRILYGAMVGAFTMGFRYFGVYETGVCFAILAVNSISGWLDRTEVRLHELIKSGRYFKEKKTGKGDAE